MKAKKVVSCLLAFAISLCVVGCGDSQDSAAPSPETTTPNNQTSKKEEIIVTPDILLGDNSIEYVDKEITIVGYPGTYKSFDDSTNESLKEMGEGYLYVTSTPEAEVGQRLFTIICVFDGDQSNLFTDEFLGEFKKNDSLIGITGIYKEGALMADCNPEVKTYDKADIPFYHNTQKEETAETTRQLINLDITYVYDEDIAALLNHQFTINKNEVQPYVTFYCSNNGAGIEATYTCKLPATSSDKEYESSWNLKLYNGTTRDCTGHTYFLTGDMALNWKKPFGNYIQEDTLLFKITQIVYTGYDNILE